MTIKNFEEQMKNVLHKMSEASGLDFEEIIVDADPDCIADFGSDYEGNLCLYGESLPLKINDMTGIRFRWDGETYDPCGFVRCDFGENIHLDCCFDDYACEYVYHVKYKEIRKGGLKKEKAIELLKHCVSSNQ